MTDFMNTAIQIMVKDLQKKKDDLIYQRLAERNLLTEFESEKRRRFKKFVYAHLENGKEEIWYNDGTEQGQLIITFYPLQSGLTNEVGNYSLNAEIKYK